MQKGFNFISKVILEKIGINYRLYSENANMSELEPIEIVSDDNKEYYLLLSCLCELPTMIKLVFKVSSNDLKKYINEKVKIKYNSELVKECWYLWVY